MHELNPQDLEKFQRKLTELRDALQQQFELGRSGADKVVLDQTKIGRLSRIDALQQQQIAASSQQSVTRHLRMVHKALAKIQSGDYGYCDECGEVIDKARLEVRPEAPYCLDCQSGME